MTTHDCKLLIIGGGPAGLTAAIYAGSEGLSPILIDSGPKVGGQARQSSLIENYAGFPEGISGPELLNRFCLQASKFATLVHCPHKARTMRVEGSNIIVNTDDDEYVARSVLLSIGLSYMRLNAPGVADYFGKGIGYGAEFIDPMKYQTCRISIIGGANSAGQAAMHFSQNPAVAVNIIARSPLEDKMSEYLVTRIRACPNITVIEGAEVSKAVGKDGKLCGLELKNKDDTTSSVEADYMYIFIGAQPKVDWLNGSVGMDSKKFILTGHRLSDPSVTFEQKLWKAARPPFQFETSIPGVLSIGDVRLGSVKRIGAAVGEGSASIPIVHELLKQHI